MQMLDTDAQLGLALRSQLAKLGLAIATIQPANSADAEGGVALVTIQPGASVSYPSLDELVSEVVTGDIAVQLMDAGVEAGADDLGMVRFVTHMTEHSIAMLLLALLSQLAPGVPVPPLVLVRAIAPALTDLNSTSLHEACTRSRGAQLAVAALQRLIDDGYVLHVGSSVRLAAPLSHPDSDPLHIYAQRCVEGVIYESIRGALEAGDGSVIFELLPHLLYVAERSAEAATSSSVHIALLCAAVFASIVPDEEAMGYWVSRACGLITDEIISGTALGPQLTVTFAEALYNLAREAEDAHFLPVAQAAYLRSFELRQRLPASDEEGPGLPAVQRGETWPVEIDWFVTEQALRLSLEVGRHRDALYICAQVAQASNLSQLHEHRAGYLMALVNQAAGDLATARQRLEPIIAWLRQHERQIAGRGAEITYLFGAALSMVELLTLQGDFLHAAGLIDWTRTETHDYEAAVGDQTDNLDDPCNDPERPRHRFWIRLLRIEAQLALSCSRPAEAERLLGMAYERCCFALGEGARETRHISALRLMQRSAGD